MPWGQPITIVLCSKKLQAISTQLNLQFNISIIYETKQSCQ